MVQGTGGSSGEHSVRAASKHTQWRLPGHSLGAFSLPPPQFGVGSSAERNQMRDQRLQSQSQLQRVTGHLWVRHGASLNKVGGRNLPDLVTDMPDSGKLKMLDIVGSPWILDPMGDVYYYWLVISSVPVVYNWTMLVSRCSFSELRCRYLSTWLALDYLSDFIYLLNVAVRFNTGHLEQGMLVTERRAIARRYVRTAAFRLDAASLLPTDLLAVWLGPCSPALRLNRLLGLPRLLELLERAETRTSHPNALRVGRVMGLMVVAIHWNACAYFALSSHLGFGIDDWVYPNLSEPAGPRISHQYLYSFYFATLILTTIGNTPVPSREEEYLFVVVDLIMAVLLFASIVGSVESIMTEMDRAKRVSFPDHQQMKDYLRRKGVSPSLCQQVTQWSQHLQLHTKLTNESRVLRLLPDRLRAQVAVNVHLRTLSKVQLFQSCEDRLLEQLVLRLQLQVFSPGDYVCRKGDVGREMYFVQEGRLAVVSDDGHSQFAVLEDGSYFGEISILNIPGSKAGNRRTANIRSLGYSDLFVLGKDELTEVLLEFPEARTALEGRGREMLMKMGLLEEDAAQRDEGPEGLASKAQRLETALDSLHTGLARLVVERQSGLRKMNLRLSRLEQELSGWMGDGGLSESRGEGLALTQAPSQMQIWAQAQAPSQTKAQSQLQAQA
ncbi:cyclic nucleotide-gated cation channel alpha-4-like [Pristis pectinata]|uniref:cyclic nucleotide-gated cation channel alpha-4-like n=1 Tax=Pristis pectinata TaxID=685728 RepID=UPI00223E1E08|nr:cyclic nucleotide-gated cation channel alpha-4-like [Pristis pectinata]